MAEELYDLMFRGEIIKGFELPQVKKNLQQLFRISEAQVSVLFSGKDVPLKKRLDADMANKYRVAMKKAGAIVNVRQAQTQHPETAQTPVVEQKTDNKKSTPAPNAAAEFGTELGAQPTKAASARVPIDAPDFHVAEVGANILEKDERHNQAVVPVDTSHLDVAEMSGNLMRDDELERLPVLEIDVPEFDLAPPGSDVLNPDERREHKAPEVDTSQLTLAETGARIGPESAEAPPPPKVDHIKLAD